MTTSIRFSDEEMIAISAAADRKQTSRHEFMRQAILSAAGPATSKATPAPAIPVAMPLRERLEPVTNPIRNIHFHCGHCSNHFHKSNFCKICSETTDRNVCQNCCTC